MAIQRSNVTTHALLLLALTTVMLAQPTVASMNHTVVSRHLASSSGNIAACYSPMHSRFYPFGREALAMESLKQSIDDDFALMAKHITHVRTFYSQFFGINVAQYAAKHGLKVYLGVFMTTETWGTTEIDAAVEAVQKYPGTVEAIIVGNENLFKGVSAANILSVVSTIKSRLGSAAGSVKFGTVQRITEYMDQAYDSQTKALEANLDILGVNIYPFFDRNFNAAKPAALLETLWSNMAKRFSVSKMRLTETGFPTAGPASAEAPNVWPSLETSYAYYDAVRQWVPEGAENTPKFWFGMFDRRPDDNTMGLEFEKHFGFYTHQRAQKRDGYPLALSGAPAPAPAPAPALAPAPVSAPTREPTSAPSFAPMPTQSPQPTQEPTQAPEPTPGPGPAPEPTAPTTFTPSPIKQFDLTSSPTPSVTSSPTTGATSQPPTPSPTWTMDLDNEEPTPAPTPAASTLHPTPAPTLIFASDLTPTPCPTWNNYPTPAPTTSDDGTNPVSGTSDSSDSSASSSSSSDGSSSASSMESESTIQFISTLEISADAESEETITIPSSIIQKKSPSTEAPAKETSGATIVSKPCSLLVLVVSAAVAFVHVL